MEKLQEIKDKVAKANPLTPFSLNEVEYLLALIEKKQIRKKPVKPQTSSVITRKI